MLTEELFTNAFKTERAVVRCVCRKFFPAKDDVDDMEATAWLEAWRSRAFYEVRAAPQAFVAGVAKNQCAEEKRFWRQKKRSELEREEPVGEWHPLDDVSDPTLAPDELVIRFEEERQALALLGALPRRQRRAILMLHAGHSRRDIAHRLKTSVRAVGRLLQNAYRSLRGKASALSP